jgi:hypothetical protein
MDNLNQGNLNEQTQQILKQANALIAAGDLDAALASRLPLQTETRRSHRSRLPHPDAGALGNALGCPP